MRHLAARTPARTGPSKVRSRGGPPRAGERAPSTSAARWRRSRAARPTWTPAVAPSGLACSWPSRVCSIRAERPSAGWAYCHVPLGSTEDMTERIEAQVERFAPGFRSLILARHVSPPAALQQANPNEIDGDIGGGSNTLWQLLARPILAACPYATPLPGLYLCSSSTPPGGGVHGMCGYHAAQAALRRTFPGTGRMVRRALLRSC